MFKKKKRMESQPNEVVQMILEHLSRRQRLSVSRVCRIWCFLVSTFKNIIELFAFFIISFTILMLIYSFLIDFSQFLFVCIEITKIKKCDNRENKKFSILIINVITIQMKKGVVVILLYQTAATSIQTPSMTNWKKKFRLMIQLSSHCFWKILLTPKPSTPNFWQVSPKTTQSLIFISSTFMTSIFGRNSQRFWDPKRVEWEHCISVIQCWERVKKSQTVWLRNWQPTQTFDS